VTANEVEFKAVTGTLDPKDKGEWKAKDDLHYFVLEEINGAQVVVTQSEMGAGTLHGAQQTVNKGIEAYNPSSIILTGIAFGIDESSQTIGEILVSTQLIPYEPERIGTGAIGEERIILRGSKPDASPRLVNRTRSALHRWKGAPVTFGPILTGEKLVDNVQFRDRLKMLAPEAIGGEMEGNGVYLESYDKKVDWILIKAICDFADGKKGTDKHARQQLAAENAAKFVLHVLQFAPWGSKPWKPIEICGWIFVAIITLLAVWRGIHRGAPEPYDKQRWSWAGSSPPDRSAWKFPGPWEISSSSFGERPALVINGPAWEAGWPREFDDPVLYDFILRFKVLFPDANDSDGTKLVWLIRSQDHGLGYQIARSYETGMDAVGGYQFRLIKETKDLYVSGSVVRRRLSQPVLLDDKPLKLGLHCCRSTTEYEVVVRVYRDHLDNCITPTSPTNLKTGVPDDPDTGHTGAAYFRDSTFSWGSIGFASGDAAKRAIVRDIEVISLQPKFKSVLPGDPLQVYFSESFVCQ